MADLELHVHGDSHEAQDAMHGAADASQHAHDAFHELKEKVGELKESFAIGTLAAEAFEKGLEALKEGLAESWAEAAKAETADRQLAAAAGELTNEFKEQAEAIGHNLARKSEDIEAMQTLLLRYGAAPDVIGKTLVAAYDLAATKGLEVNAVLNTMIRSAEANTGQMGKLGLSFQTTGDFSENLANQIKVVNAQMGGAGDIEAGGMAGRARAASNAVDELKKSLGGLFGAIEQKTGVLEGLAGFFEQLSKHGNLDASVMAGISGAMGWGGGKKKVGDVEGANPVTGGGVDVTMGDITMAPTQKALQDQRRADDAYATAEEKLSEHLHKMMEEETNFDIEQDNKAKERLMKNLEAMDQIDKEAVKGFEKLEDDHTKDLEKLGQMQYEMLKQQTDKQAEEMKRRESMWLQIGERISKALIDGIMNAFDTNSGGGADWTKTAISIMDSIVSIVAGAYGQGWITSMISDQENQAAQFATSKHAGGWIPKYHRGGWAGEVPAMLLEGERVLSRGEVSRMGGRGGVDSAARGGGGGQVIYAMDAESMLDMLGGRMGRTMLNTVRLGRGPLPEMFGAR